MRSFLIATVLFAACLGHAQKPERPEKPPIPSYEVHWATTPVTIDGRLDDATWKLATVIEFQFPWEAQTGVKQPTRARMLWDAEYFYVGYECDDADITAQFEERDDPTYKDDAVEIFINPNPKQTDYYGLEMNARAILYDYFYVYPRMLLKRIDFAGVQLASSLDGTLNVTGDKDRGWSLEVAIPWANFEELARSPNAPEPGTEWKVNLNRWDGTEPDRRLSQWSDSGLVRADPHNPQRFGSITFRNP